MSVKLKPIGEQVIVITGASSGIGLATADLAAKRGAKLVLAARSEEAMRDVVERLKSSGTEVIFVACDVADRGQVEAIADAAIKRFGRVDTWVNNAGISIYGRLDEVTDEDNRRLFDTNFWGVVYGSLAALPHLKLNGGALINLGSEVSEAYMPLLGIYTASKHAVKGFTDALRVETEILDNAPVSITLIQPTAVDTPFPQHARNYQDQEAALPTPMIEPKRVAKAILSAAVKPTRKKKVGTMAKVNTATAKLAPALADQMSSKQAQRLHYDESPRHPEGALDDASETTGVVGQTHGTGGHKPR
jgi:short-subunit dehydrogenase